MVIVLSGPSGVGKTTIGKKVLEDEELASVIKKVPTFTTRPPREGEVDGEDYIFVSKTEFAIEMAAGNLLEWVEIFGNFYGTSRKVIKDILMAGKSPMLIIDVRGGSYVKKNFEDVLDIFIMPPSEEVLRRRLKARGNIAEDDLALRFSISHDEIEEGKNYSHIVVNDVLDDAVNEVKRLIKERLRR